MAWTDEDLKALDTAIALGARRVQYRDKEVEYRTLDEMMRVRALILGSLEGPGASGRGTRRYASVSKGVRP